MPCREWDPETNISSLTSTVCDLQSQLAKAPKASLLCEAMALLEEHGLLEKASADLKKWYADHESQESHKVRLEAAEKLTKRERRLLGIDLENLKSKVKK